MTNPRGGGVQFARPKVLEMIIVVELEVEVHQAPW